MVGHDRAGREDNERVHRRRRRPPVAGDANRHARRGLRGDRAARAGGAPARPLGSSQASDRLRTLHSGAARIPSPRPNREGGPREMSNETVLWEQTGGVGTITLNRPETLNAWTAEFGQALK